MQLLYLIYLKYNVFIYYSKNIIIMALDNFNIKQYSVLS